MSQETATEPTHEHEIPEEKQYELRKIAETSTAAAVIVSCLISPLGYIFIGKWKWAAANFFTLNYLLFGIIIVPIHVYKQIQDARDELDRAGVEWHA